MALACFANGNRSIPLAAWLFPIFMVRFMRTQGAARALVVGWLALLVPSFVVTWPMLNLEILSGPARLGACVLTGLRCFLPFAVDRVLSPRVNGFLSSLVLPASWVGLEYVYALGPEGTWGGLAYTQYGQIALLQLVSVTGIWGLTFLAAWMGGVVNWAWERYFIWTEIRWGAMVFAGFLVLVLLLGGGRAAFQDIAAESVGVAGLTRPAHLPLSLNLSAGQETACLNSTAEQAYFLEKSVAAARSGARLVIWQEYAVWLRPEDEASFRFRAGEVAAREGIYLITAYGVYPPGGPGAPWKNRLVGYDPTGRELCEYDKSYPSLALEPGVRPGNRRIPIFETPYGRVAAVICTDQEHPGLLSQAGRAGVFLILSASAAWPEVDPLHAHMASFRAIENGACLFKAAGQARSVVYDHLGQVVCRLDHEAGGGGIMPARVPIQQAWTIYPRIGDLFAWLCLLLLAVLTVGVFRRGRR
jgi:apolipoprotein N-acyltransferase